jgi:hypothetical protein
MLKHQPDSVRSDANLDREIPSTTFDKTSRSAQGPHCKSVDRFLDVVRRGTGELRWPQVAKYIQQHPINAVVLEDPYTARARNKPNGYAGDAVMLDYLYDGCRAQLSTVGGM